MNEFAAQPPVSDVSDAELLQQLRAGDVEAYTELWRRHVRAALRLANRMAPGHADDLVSEAFTAVFHQIVNANNGPESAFRAYLFTTIRNTARKWQSAQHFVDTESDLDEVVDEDGLLHVSDREESANLLAAFESLPERWQQVLWLAEVEDVGREQIAAKLQLKPNAVSALLKRARAGLRTSWLQKLIPEDLRSDQTHVAYLLPELLTRGRARSYGPEVNAHLKQCQRCADTNEDLVAAYFRMRNSSLGAAGFAALGGVFPAISNAPVAAAAIASLTGATAVAASVSLLLATGITVVETEAHADTPAVVVVAEASDSEPFSYIATPAPLTTQSPVPVATMSMPAPEPVNTGRDVVDDTVVVVPVQRGLEPNDFYVAPPRPAPADPNLVPRPSVALAPDTTSAESPDTTAELIESVEPPALTDPPIDMGQPQPTPTALPAPTPLPFVSPPALAAPVVVPAPLAVGQTSPTNPRGYLAPIITGQTAAGAQVAVEFERIPTADTPSAYGELFVVETDAAGSWSLDLRPIILDSAGVFNYSVWAFTDQEVSAANSGTFTTSAPVITGFESLLGSSEMPLEEANTTGVVFQAQGPENGRICLASLTTAQAASFSLNESGLALQRLRMLDSGTFWFSFRACEGDYRGPAHDYFVDVLGEVFGPFGPGGFGFGLDTEPQFELSDP